ncbi:hypothetical protein KUTeg_016141 [Tegillarca granosa]|uniref:SAM domain-containing protein n=1 Tax=Tegillarca granosa TaxID=220873 RepID=A0ABQ9EMI4_TEGGR|nr:hypothetical protein KUTeg_016141 [Tegillarca granosa]
MADMEKMDSAIEDLKDEAVPRVLYWTVENVADWIEELGFPDYRIVAKSIRDLLTIEEPDWTRSISLPPRSDIGMYLEMKSANGKTLDGITFKQFNLNYVDSKWRPPLSNHCLILPR